MLVSTVHQQPVLVDQDRNRTGVQAHPHRCLSCHEIQLPAVRQVSRLIHSLFLPLKRHYILFLSAINLILSGLLVIGHLDIGSRPNEVI